MFRIKLTGNTFLSRYEKGKKAVIIKMNGGGGGSRTPVRK